MKMKNPLEGLFSNPKKKAKDAAIAAAFTASVLNANAAENPTTTTQNPDVTKTEIGAKVETAKDSMSTASFEAEQVRLAQIKKLEQVITAHKDSIQKLTGYLQGVQVDFQNNYLSGLKFKEGEKAKSHLVGFENKLADLAMKMGREKVANFDITSEQAVNGLMGILLSGGKNSPFEKEATYLTQFTQGQLGSAVTTGGGVNFASRGYKSPDMQIHERLGKDPREIVETALKIVKEEHKLNLAQAELNALIATPDGGATASN